MLAQGQHVRQSQTSYPWGPLWKAPTLMLLALLAGVALGVGHHAYYRSFNDTVVLSTEQQQWAVRVGTGLAFLTKTAFTAAVSIAISQYMWITVNRKALSLQSLDAILAMTSSPLSLIELDSLWHAKLLNLVGLIFWLLPLIALVTPATLTVQSRFASNSTTLSVPYPQFRSNADIAVSTNQWSDYSGAGFLGTPSPGLSRLLAAVYSSMSIIPVASPYTNASYTTQFYGPCLKCSTLADALRSPDFQSDMLQELWNSVELEYGYWYNSTDPGPYNMMFFVTSSATQSIDVVRGAEIVCQLRNASYTVDFDFVDGTTSTIITRLDFEPVLSFDESVILHMLPKDGQAYLAYFKALRLALLSALGKPPEQNCGGIRGGRDPFVTTGLVACPEIIDAYKATRGLGPAQCFDHLNETTSPWMCRKGSLREAIEDLSHNFTLSLLSSVSFSTRKPVEVRSTFPLNYYHYQPQSLAIAYLTGLGVTLACFVLGTWACYVNGHSATTSFSSIVHTTRNPELDRLMAANSSSLDDSEKSLKSVKLQLGTFRQSDGTMRGAFGTPDQIKQSHL